MNAARSRTQQLTRGTARAMANVLMVLVVIATALSLFVSRLVMDGRSVGRDVGFVG